MDKSYLDELKKNLENLKKIRANIDHIRSIEEDNYKNIDARGDDDFDECDELEEQVSSLEEIVDSLDSAIEDLEFVIISE